jgi:hypothetical protein
MRTNTKTPRVQHATGPDGKAIVRVELTNARGLHATFDRDAWEDYLSRGGNPRLFYNDNGSGTFYVRTFQPGVAGKVVSVARELLRAGRGQVVRYLNSDRLDLRTSNLSVEAGFAPGQSPGGVSAAPEALAA